MIRHTGLTLLSTLVAVAAWSATAHAQQGDHVEFDEPVGDRQTLTVTMSDTSSIAAHVLYATYRRVSSESPPPIDQACAPTMAQNGDTRLIDGVPVAAQPYDVAQSVTLPLGVFAVCAYRETGSTGDAAAATLSSTVVGGAFRAGGSGSGDNRKATSINLSISLFGSRATFSGRVAGTRRGRVAIQRRIRGRFRTVARARVRRGRYSVLLGVRPRQVYRAVLLATTKTQSSRTRSVRLQ